MADLPGKRLEERVFPFANTGVDYFGQVEVRENSRGNQRNAGVFFSHV